MNSLNLKIAPHSLEAERSILGAIVLSSRVIDKIIPIIKEEDFFRERHKIIYNAMLHLNREGYPSDIVTLKDHLDKIKKLDDAGGVEYICSLMEGTPTIANIVYHAEIIKDKADLRRLLYVGNTIRENVYENKSTPDEILNLVDVKFSKIRESRMGDKIAKPADFINDMLREAEQFAKNGQSQILGIPTGFADFDEITEGLIPATLMVFPGPPSHGKTAFAQNLINNITIRDKIPGAIFSKEMDKKRLVWRFLAIKSGVPMRVIQKGAYSQVERTAILDAAREIADSPLYIYENIVGFMELTSLIKQCVKRLKLQYVVIDYLQNIKLSPDEMRMFNAYTEYPRITFIIQELNNLKTELNIPIIVISSLDRAKGLVKGSSQPEYDADLIAYVSKKNNDPNAQIVELKIVKNRDGQPCTLEYQFTGSTFRFLPLSSTLDPTTGF